MNSSKFGIKIDYDKDAENPSRVFYAMGDLIDGIHEIQQAMLDSAGLDLKLSSKLSRTIEGSVVGVQSQSISSKSNHHLTEKQENIIKKGLRKLEMWLGQPHEICDRKPFKELTQDLQSTVDDAFVAEGVQALNVTRIDEYRVAKGAEKAINAKRNKLTSSDKVFIGGDSNSNDPSCAFNEKLAITRTVDDIYTEIDDFFHERITLEISNAAFSGDVWKFKWLCKLTGRQEFSAKIMHAEWLERWLNRQEPILPGDGLLVNMRVYLTNKAKRNKNEIEFVHCVVPREQMQQLELESEWNNV